eukprot:TRINITY_DN5378_c0_g1_i6.p1 TRINITY_DN5378_c0_g1~~TRINITY_DN5378_c0_g1_i6.p1  ORF type:complete len:120 (+),score=25.75 TRINITY_DN5378_c0_g1_i6:29-361(+)
MGGKFSGIVYDHVVKNKHFSVCGARQFVHDMHALFLLFRPYSAHPENCMKQVKDVTAVLSLPIQDIMRIRQLANSGDLASCYQVLQQCQLSKLSSSHAISICNLVILPHT